MDPKDVKKGQTVIYIDGLGRAHDALVAAVNGMNEGYVNLVHVDTNAPEADNLKKVFDVAHISDASLQEPNPNLPSYDVNAWKFPGELHRALPSDHPGYDHPFEPKKLDEQGNIIPKPRPLTEAELAAHQKGLEQKAAAAPNVQSSDVPTAEELASQSMTNEGAPDAPQTSASEPDVTQMLDQAPPPPADPEPPEGE